MLFNCIRTLVYQTYKPACKCNATTLLLARQGKNINFKVLLHASAMNSTGKSKMGKKGKNKDKGATSATSYKTTLRPTQKIPASVNLVVIGTGGPGTSKCLLLTTEYSRYMFNCGEGSQRLTVMNKCLKSFAYAKVSGIENIFITHKSWENTGGLLGIAMLVESQKNPDIKNFAYRQKQKLGTEEVAKTREKLPELTLHGPDGIENITMMARKFAERSNMDIVRKQGVFEDFAVKIAPVVLSKNQTAETVVNPESANSESVTLNHNSDSTYAYLCQAKPLPPKINVEKCVDAGITLGPMVGELQRGNPVTLPDGTVVTPEQVTDTPNSSNNSFLVLECPSEDFLPALEGCEELNQYRGDCKEECLGIVVHMTPSAVLNTEVYQRWMKSFGQETDHLIMNDNASPADMGRVRNHQAQLNVVHPEVFPLLPPIETPQIEEGQHGDQGQKVMHGCSGMVYTLRGRNPGFHIETDDIDVATLQSELLLIPEVKEELDNLKIISPPVGAPFPKVVFLGTGSSEPNRIRAQSCIAVHLNEESLMILDCGEDSYGQLFRFYGKEETCQALLKLKAIFVSHMHGDHHLGLLTLLKERRKAFESSNIPFTPVLLMAPIQMRRWLKFYHCEVEQVFDLFRFYKHQRDLKEYEDNFVMNTATDEDILNTLDFTHYSAVEVIHSRNSYGVVFTHRTGFKLVYSGDTRPTDKLVEAGQDCDLLIHEATHEDDLTPQAQFSRHSTFSEAMDVGKRMKAKQIILTHFSQRYPHMVPFYGMDIPDNVGVAFDNMQVSQQNLPLLNKFIPPLTHIFADKLQSLEIKSLKRNREKAELDQS